MMTLQKYQPQTCKEYQKIAVQNDKIEDYEKKKKKKKKLQIADDKNGKHEEKKSAALNSTNLMSAINTRKSEKIEGNAIK